MKIKINQTRTGKILRKAPMSISIYDDNGNDIGKIFFRPTSDLIHLCTHGNKLKLMVNKLGVPTGS